jgi:hypothetical protein
MAWLLVHGMMVFQLILLQQPTLDGETMVTRKIDGVQKAVKSHITIKRYNRFMQAVDRNDQLRVALSLATRHAFKKYYIKYFLSLFDICMTNAMVHYFLRNNQEKKKRYHKADFSTKVADELCDSKNHDFKALYGKKGLAGKEKLWMTHLPLSYLLPQRKMVTFLHRLNATSTVLSSVSTGASGNTTLK